MDLNTTSPAATIRERASNPSATAFEVRPVGLVKCLTCNHVAAASEHRPGDPVEVPAGTGPAPEGVARVPLVCPMCGTSGHLLLGLGPWATAEDMEVLRHLFRRRLLVA